MSFDGSRTLLRRFDRARKVLDPAAFHVAWIALFFVVSYAISYSPSWPAPTYLQSYLNIAILFLDAVILYALATATVSGWRPARRVWVVIAAPLLVGLVLLHLDYLAHRYVVFTGSGVTGSFQRIKESVIATQLCLLLVVLLVAAPAGAPLARRLPSRWDVAACLLCAAPLLNYFLLNRSYFSALSGVEYFASLLGIPLLVLTVGTVLGGLLSYRWNLAAWIGAGMWLLYARPMILAALKVPVDESVAAQLLLMAVLPAVAALVHARKPALLGMLAMFLSLGAVIGGQFGGGSGAGHDAAAGEPGSEESSGVRLADVPSFVVKPDVYFLIYDSYVPNALMRKYGIDNSGQVAFLESKGFRIYDGAYTAHPSSLGAISRVLDMSLEPREHVGGPNLSSRIFKREGYERSLVLASYFLQGLTAEPDADFVYPKLRQRSGVEAVYLGLRAGEFNPGFVFTEHSYSEWLNEKRRILALNSPAPKFHYSHSRFPGHSQNSGKCLSNEIEQFERRLAAANEEMSADIETILRSDRDAVIIVAGDHGPFLTGDCFALATRRPDEVTAVELADRYGVFLAIRWPDGMNVKDEPLHFLPNLFAFLVDQLSGGQYPVRLPGRTIGFSSSIPANAIREGVVMIGVDKGRPLYDAVQ